MKNFPKAGLLIVTLVIPALIFTLLNFFAKNHYDLPYFVPEKDLTGNVFIQNGDTLFSKVNNICPALGTFDFSNKLTVVSSLPEVCGDSCEIVYAQLERIIGLTKEIPQLVILTLSDSNVSSNRKLPETMGKDGWILKQNSDNPSECFDKEPLFKKKLAGADPAAGLILIDEKGFVRGFYRGGQADETERLMAEIKILDYETKTKKQ